MAEESSGCARCVMRSIRGSFSGACASGGEAGVGVKSVWCGGAPVRVIV